MTAVQALVVSGFLGSGKTTLVRRLLEDAQRSGQRVAVISNEFGALGIDQSLLGGSAEAYVELEGGCVCCKLADDRVETLQLLDERVAPERIIVETSGVALPYDTQLNFWRPPVNAWVEDDLAVVVVDAEQVREERELEGTFEDQVSSAELIVLNKLDLVSESDLPAIEARLSELSDSRAIVRCVRGDVDPRLLFLPPEQRPERRSAREHRHEAFESHELRIEAGLDPDELEARVLAEDALRAKGYAQTTQGLRLVQRVGPRVELLEVRSPPPPGLVGRIVVIRRAD